MAIDLLKRLAASPLPAYFYAPEEVDKVKLLRAAGLVIALTPLSGTGVPDSQRAIESAQVLAITAKGREELARFELPCRPKGDSFAAAASWKSRVEAALRSRFLQ